VKTEEKPKAKTKLPGFFDLAVAPERAPVTEAEEEWQKGLWAKRIAKARERGYFTDTDAAWAERWSTCAIGEAFNLKRKGWKADDSIDLAMMNIGAAVDGGFAEAVLGDKFDLAERRLKEAYELAKKRGVR